MRETSETSKINTFIELPLNAEILGYRNWSPGLRLEGFSMESSMKSCACLSMADGRNQLSGKGDRLGTLQSLHGQQLSTPGSAISVCQCDNNILAVGW